MKKYKSTYITVLIGLIFLYQKEYLPSLVIISLGLYLLIKEIRNPKRVIERAILADEHKFKTKIPTSYPLYLNLISLYSKYLSFQTHYPLLKMTYQERISNMWKRLSTKTEITEWKRIIEEVDQNWPIPVDMQRFTR